MQLAEISDLYIDSVWLVVELLSIITHCIRKLFSLLFVCFCADSIWYYDVHLWKINLAGVGVYDFCI